MAGGRFEVALTPRPRSPRTGSRASSSWSPPTRASRRSRSPRSPRAASCRACRSRSRPWRAQVAQVPTLIFDEVDAGIGGRVAEIVGQDAEAAGRRHQVMCITHLPQVAALGRPAVAGGQEHAKAARCSSRVTALDREAARRGDRAHAGRREDHGDDAQARGGDAGGQDLIARTPKCKIIATHNQPLPGAQG